jgi:predicted PurR-regulated permease PerM
MDKILAVIIIFLAITFSLAGILAMGAIPELFKQGKQLDQALVQQHEDEGRANQSATILRETNKSITDLEHRLVKFINESTNRSLVGAEERQKIMDNINIVQEKVDNTTKQTYDLLKLADQRNFEATMKNNKLIDNLTKTVNELKQMHDSIIKTLDEIKLNP